MIMEEIKKNDSNENVGNAGDKQSEKQKKPVKKQSNADFKRKYFEYYDDIKISDRQDW